MLARTLGPSGMGEWAMVIAAGTILHSLLLNWMHAPMVRFGREEWVQTGSMANTWSSRWPFIMVGLLLCCGLLLFVPFQWLTLFFHLDCRLAPIVFIAIMGLWLSTETQNLMQVRGEFARLGYMSICIDLASIIMLFLVQLGQVSVKGVYTLFLLLQGCNAILWGIALLSVWRTSNFEWHRPTWVTLQRNLKYAWPLIPGFLLGFASDWGDQLILRFYFSSREVGLFQSAYQVMMLLLGLSALISSVLLPRLIDKNFSSTTGARDFMITNGPTTVALGLYLLIPVISAAPFLFSIFMGAQFVAATKVFIVLCAAVPGSLLSSFYGTFFNIQGRFLRSTVLMGSIKIAFNLSLSLVLVPRIGIMGSAIATVISYGVLQYLYFRDQHRYYQVPSTKIIVLFVVIVLFSITQTVAGNQSLIRAIICCLGLVLLTFVSRKFEMLDKNTVKALCSGRMSGVGSLILHFAYSEGPRGHSSYRD